MLMEFEPKLMEFHQKYNLLVGGALNENTLGLMHQLNCIKGGNKATESSKFKFSCILTTKSIRLDKTIT